MIKLWLVEEEKRYTTSRNQSTTGVTLWLVEEEKRYTTRMIGKGNPNTIRGEWTEEKKGNPNTIREEIDGERRGTEKEKGRRGMRDTRI